MKRFLLFLVIAIAVVSLGLTIYYFSTDNEVIIIKSSYLVVEKDTPIPTQGLLEFKNKSEYTTLTYSVEQPENSNVLSYSNGGYYLAMNGGEGKIVITTNNSNYSKLIISVLVCDGSAEYPYMIKDEESLRKIGNDTVYTKSCSFKLGNDIILTSNWVPIDEYSGTFDGNYHTISNMTVDGTFISAGLVSTLDDTGIIKNLFLTDINIDVDAQNVGAFVGTNKGIVQTCEANGTIKNSFSGSTSYVGGIVGKSIFTSIRPKIDRCGFIGTFDSNGTQQYIGGVAGLNQSGIVSECFYRGLVKNNESFFGGIVNTNQGTADGTGEIYDSYFYLTAKDESKTIFSRMSGIVHQNIFFGTSDNNMVTGNYYGGEILTTDNVVVCQINGIILSTANKHLTKTEFVDKTKFITSTDGTTSRRWNFNTVWEMGTNYPILNVYSSIGSSYIIDVSEVTGADAILEPINLYNVLSNLGTLGDGNLSEDNSYYIANDISFSDIDGGFVWGDATHPIPDSFNGTITNSDGFKITNLTITNTIENQNVGLVKELGTSAIISGLLIEGVTITGQKGNYVGVVAGKNNGANVFDVSVTHVDVQISGYAFGTMFGYTLDYVGHGIKNVTAKYVDSTGYFVYAGGIAGVNYTTITATTDIYNYVYDFEIVSNYFGGIVGYNYGDISYSTAYGIKFDKIQDSLSILNVYNGENDIFLGGIAGINKGNIVDVYSNIFVKGETGANYEFDVGGITGYNSGSISRGYVKSSTFETTKSQSCCIGGVSGYNAGRVLNCVVDKDSKIITSSISSVSTTTNGNNYTLSVGNCSIVGGLVGYDKVTNSISSIYQSASLMKEIKGFYAGGLVGITFGKIESSYCGDSSKTNGGVSITGFLSGGLGAVVGGGYIKNCYSFCGLNSVNYSGKYTNVLSVVKLEVSAMAGLCVLVLNSDTVLDGCYCVANFNGNGVSYGSSADLTGYNGGSITNSVYQTAGSISTSYGKQILATVLKGSDNFQSFMNAIGGNSLSVWAVSNGFYPILDSVDVRLPNSTLPVFH